MKTPGYSLFEMAPLERRPNNARSAARGFRRGSIKPKRINILSRALLNLSAIAFITCSANAQIQQAWVARYNNGVTNGFNQAAKIAIDSADNICIGGFSQSASGNIGYVTLKYAPNGTQLWSVRYPNTTGYLGVGVGALVTDASNNVVVTGGEITIKYDSNGNQLWTAPYAGTALAADNQGNVYVAGFSTNFGTVKLSPQGSNLWLETYVDSYGPTVSQSVLTDGGGNVYASGLDTYTSYYVESQLFGPFVQLTTIKYGSDGSQLWKASQDPTYATSRSVQITGAALDASNNLYLVANFTGGAGSPYFTVKYNTAGTALWTASPNSGLASGLAIDSNADVLLTGRPQTCKLNSDGSTAWEADYPNPAASSATSIAVDSAGNSYVTGFSPGTNSFNDIVTIKYDPNGNQVWLQRYNAYNVGNAQGNAIAVDKNGNVYVTGYETLPGGGTGIVTIKYSPVVLQRRSDGAFILQAQGSPGENFEIEASQDLQSWLNLGRIFADSNGLAQFTDTNAPAYPARFYLANPQ
jgi:hypothetical protein